MRRIAALVIAIGSLAACQRTDHKKSGDQKAVPVAVGSGAAGDAARPKPTGEQVTPPVDLKTPPADAIKTASGLVYKKLSSNDAGTSPSKNDTVVMNYNAWIQSTGETFFTTKTRGQPMPLNLSNAAPGFVEGLQLLKKGEKAVIWIPPEIGYKQPPKGKPETLVYEVEIVEIVAAPAIPVDVAAPPATALTLPSGAKYEVIRPGTGTEKARSFDTVTFNFTAWDSNGHMFDSTEVRKRPASVPPFRQSAVMQEVLTSMTAGERVRFWVDADKLSPSAAPNAPKGQVCYEVESLQIEKAKHEPPPTPADVAAPPTSAKKTAKGVAYVVLKSGHGGKHPLPSDTVKVDYTGWTTDGRMFDSSIVRGEPAEFSLAGVIAGWTEGIPVMSVGDSVRFWIPEELAYKGNPGRPQGMLVFDVNLLEIKDAAAAPTQPAAAGKQPAPSDVAAPPKDAKKSPKGVFYKIIKPGPAGGAHPTAADTVKVHYTGWTTNGEMFDSSRTSGNPISFPLKGVIPGWTDSIPMMAVGDQMRIWIPEELAYKGQQGAPQGMLVFDVELLAIEHPGAAGQANPAQ